MKTRANDATACGTPIMANGVIYVQSNTYLFAFRDATKQYGFKDEPQKIEIN